MRADLTAAGDQVGCTDLMTAAMPETCGHDMDVPESKFHSVERLSRGITVGDDLGGHAARMFTPGAVTSGCHDQDAPDQRKNNLQWAEPVADTWTGPHLLLLRCLFMCV
jgi:hypothetical protein